MTQISVQISGSTVEFSLQEESAAIGPVLAWRRPAESLAWGFDTVTRFQYVAQKNPAIFRAWALLCETGVSICAP